MSKLIVIFTIVVAALCASGFKLESVFPVADYPYPNMYVEHPDDGYTCEYPYFTIGGCETCGNCKLYRGKPVPVIFSCTPTVVIDKLNFESSFTYYIFGIPSTVNNKTTEYVNCKPGVTCELANTYDTLPESAPPGKYSFSLRMERMDGYPFANIPDCGVEVI